MFVVIAGTKLKGCTDLVEALGEVAVVPRFHKVTFPPKLLALDEARADFVEFSDRQVTALLKWLAGRVEG